MARSIAASVSAGRFGLRSRRSRFPPAPPARSLPWPLGVGGQALGAASDRLRDVFTAAWRRRRLRVALLAALAALPLLGGAWLWLRHSSLVAVEQVRISGVAGGQGMQRGQIEAALTGAARGMSTLDVQPGALLAAVARYPIVQAVHARARVPHGLDVEVVEQPPVAALEVGGRAGTGARTAVAADGIVLGPVYLSSSLPLIHTQGVVPAIGHGVGNGPLLVELTALGAAPAPLAHLVQGAYFGRRGLTLAFRGGLLAFFGDATRAHAKWLSLARVLADPDSAGAAYVDVRLPERPAAGFAPGTAPPDGTAGEAGQAGGADPQTASELAAGLDEAVAGTSTGTGTGEPGTTTATSEGSTAGESSAGTAASEPGSGGETGGESATGTEATG